ncbi:LOW QUALITY PROTEIN: arylacetamide deacetylase-like [Trichechus inunguis]
MGKKTLLLLMVGVLLAYYAYTPFPDNVEERWKLISLSSAHGASTPVRTVTEMATSEVSKSLPVAFIFETGWDALLPMFYSFSRDEAFQVFFLAFTSMARFAELLGISSLLNAAKFVLSLQEVAPTSDDNVTVTDTTFNNIPVRVYVPKRKSETPRRGLFYIHGGGWSMGSAAMFAYDLLSRQTADRLNAVVLSTNHRLTPEYHFPIQFEDVYTALRWFLRQDVLEKYGVNLDRVGISGDSAGGNLAAAVTQQLLDDPLVKTKLKIQSLIYPPLQALDMDLPSYWENTHFLFLTKSFRARLWSECFTTDSFLEKAMLSKQHVPVESSHLFKFVNWSSLLPERFKKGHIYKNPTPSRSELAKKYPGFLDVRASPWLADDSKLCNLPLTYLITCQYDVLRDDGLMYVTLQNAGIQVTHNHTEAAFHTSLYQYCHHYFKLPYQKLIRRHC